jgi:hypothetical protein
MTTKALNRICRGCGCTDDHACPEGCWWVDLDLVGFKGGPLCSTCAPDQGRAYAQTTTTEQEPS